MTTLTFLVICVVAMALLFDFVNGWNDSANAIATVVGTRVLSPTSAVVLAAALNLAGAMAGTEVANTMAKLIHVSPETLAEQYVVMILIIAGLLSAALWAGLMTVVGLPISGSHSLIGGIVGAAVAAGGVDVLVAGNVLTTIIAMIVAPVTGFVTAYFGYVLLIRGTWRMHPSTMNRVFGRLQILSASWMAFTHRNWTRSLPTAWHQRRPEGDGHHHDGSPCRRIPEACPRGRVPRQVLGEDRLRGGDLARHGAGRLESD